MRRLALTYLHFLFMGIFSLSYAQQYAFMKMIPPAPDSRVKNAVSVGIGPDRKYYVLDYDAASIFGYDSTGAQTDVITDVTVDGKSVRFKKPVDFCIDQRGVFYIADEGLGKILVRHTDGAGMILGTEGSDLGQISDVKSIAVNYNGYVYVLSGGTKRVDVFSPNGQYRSWIAGGTENFRKPVAIGINGANELYVLDKAGPAVYLFDGAGNFIGMNQHRENIAGVSIGEATDIAVMKNGDYFIVDGDASKVTQFRRGGQSVGTMGGKGSSSKGVFEKAERVATSASISGILLILDRANGEIQQFRIPAGTSNLVTPSAPPEMKAVKTTVKPFVDLVFATNNLHYIIPESDQSTVEVYSDSNDVPVVSFKVKKAVALATDDSANLFVLDNGACEVIKYDKQGVLIRRFGQEISERLKDPTGIAVLSDGSVVVADHSTQTIKRWTNAGVFDRTLVNALSNVMESPYKVKVDGKDMIYVWDDNLDAISRFQRDGTQKGAHLLRLRTSDASKDKGKIAGFAIDTYDQIHAYNATTSQYEVFKWDEVPQNVFRYGRPSENNCDACFANISHVGLDQRTFTAYASSSKENRVTAFTLPFIIKANNKSAHALAVVGNPGKEHRPSDNQDPTVAAPDENAPVHKQMPHTNTNCDSLVKLVSDKMTGKSYWKSLIFGADKDGQIHVVIAKSIKSAGTFTIFFKVIPRESDPPAAWINNGNKILLLFRDGTRRERSNSGQHAVGWAEIDLYPSIFDDDSILISDLINRRLEAVRLYVGNRQQDYVDSDFREPIAAIIARSISCMLTLR